MGTSGMRTMMMMMMLLLLLCTITVGIQNVAAVRGNGDEVSQSCSFLLLIHLIGFFLLSGRDEKVIMMCKI
jgi:hypothetical protein